MTQESRILGKGCINCDARFAFRDVRPLLYRLRLGVGFPRPSYRPAFRISYTAPEASRLRCQACLMEHELPQAERLRVEVIYWMIGLTMSVGAVVALFWAFLPPAPPPLSLEEEMRAVMSGRNDRAAHMQAAVWLALLSIPLVLFCFWSVRRAVVPFARLTVVASQVHPTMYEATR